MSRRPKVKTVTRRKLISALLFGGAITTLASPRRSFSQVAQRVDVKHPAALAVGYVENVNQVDLKKFPSYVKDSTCENCALLQGSAGQNYRPCSLFDGKLVSIGGWCSGWAPEI